MNNSEKMFNICVNTPSGKSTFVKAVPTDGSEAHSAEFIKEMLITNALEVPCVPFEELIATQACFSKLSALSVLPGEDVIIRISLQIYVDEDGELSDRLLGFIGDGESANRKALRDLEGQYYFLVNLWCQAHCISLFLKVSIPKLLTSLLLSMVLFLP